MNTTCNATRGLAAFSLALRARGNTEIANGETARDYINAGCAAFLSVHVGG